MVASHWIIFGGYLIVGLILLVLTHLFIKNLNPNFGDDFVVISPKNWDSLIVWLYKLFWPRSIDDVWNLLGNGPVRFDGKGKISLPLAIWITDKSWFARSILVVCIVFLYPMKIFLNIFFYAFNVVNFLHVVAYFLWGMLNAIFERR
ncbi:MAG: hypothetical protein OEV93_01905 [Candidatus Moranbacteria bacterium]|nr:hypothetical protein [Candidatus Moranbacteria bacterium]